MENLFKLTNPGSPGKQSNLSLLAKHNLPLLHLWHVTLILVYPLVWPSQADFSFGAVSNKSSFFYSNISVLCFTMKKSLCLRKQSISFYFFGDYNYVQPQLVMPQFVPHFENLLVSFFVFSSLGEINKLISIYIDICFYSS